MYITKKDGRIVIFDNEKITNSILRANAGNDHEKLSPKRAAVLAEKVFELVVSENEVISTADVNRAVLRVLRENELPSTAESYESYSGKMKNV